MSRLSLDRPIWSALGGAQASMALGNPLARRYRSDISPFAAARDDGAEALEALAGLLDAQDSVVLLEAGAVAIPPGLVIERQAFAVQLVAETLPPPPPAHDVIDLGDADAIDMLGLASLTAPGPFVANTHLFGGFIGVRVNGRLAAMAGERLKPDGFAEVSGVCTHPDCRGRGLAGRLSTIVARRIAARGDTPFLHAYRDNKAAIRLYEALGFRVRAEMTMAVLRRP